MDELEESDRINEGTNTEDTDHTDQINQYDIHLESSSPLSTEAPIDDIIPEIGHKPSDEQETEIGNRVVRSLERTCMMYL